MFFIPFSFDYTRVAICAIEKSKLRLTQQQMGLNEQPQEHGKQMPVFIQPNKQHKKVDKVSEGSNGGSGSVELVVSCENGGDRSNGREDGC